MNNVNRFNLPYCMVVEEGIFQHVDEVLSIYMPNIGKEKAVIVTEESLKNLFPAYLEEITSDFEKCELYLVDKNSYDEAVELAKYVCMNHIRTVIGFGGGKVLDVAKYAAFVSRTTYLCLPTTLSNDSLASPFSVLDMTDTMRKTLCCRIPTGIFVDTDVIMGAPVSQLKAGIGDTISKYTALYDWKLDAKQSGQRVDDFAYTMAEMAMNSVCFCEDKSLKSKNFIKILSQALVMGGLAMEIAGSSRPSSGSEHLFCHSLEENYPQIPISHGMAVALGSVASCIFQGRDEEKLLEVLRAYEIDINPMSYGITKEIFCDAWQKAMATRKDRFTILNLTDLNLKWLEDIYSRMVSVTV